MTNLATIDLNLHRKQGQAFLSKATEILYGGAAGGGKSHLMRCAAIIWCAAIAGLQVYIFRRIREDLVKNHIEGPKGFRAMLQPWVRAGLVVIVEDEIRFWNGSKIWLCHCKDEKDRFKYLGAEIHVLLIDELTTFTELIYRFLRSRVRAVGLNIPVEYQGLFPRIICGSNPGNIGHAWVKAGFIDGSPPMTIRQMPDVEGGMRRQFIPARLDDNPSMESDDPTYRAKLRGLGSEQLVRAMEDGDWNVIEGAFFAEFSSERHVIKPFSIPAGWARFRAFDWGSAKPFSVGWYAVSDGTMPIPGTLRRIPNGALIKYREWYGAKRNADGKVVPNVGLKLTAEEIAAGIIERSRGERYAYSVADPAIFSEDGGPSHAERMRKRGVIFRAADNARVTGWDQLRARLKGDADSDHGGEPLIYFFETCTEIIRTLPVLQHDDSKPEDVNSDMEDHAPDETRYAAMSRPRVLVHSGQDSGPKPGTFDHMIKITDEPKKRSKYRR